MSMLECNGCGDIADTDDDPDGWRMKKGKDVFHCEKCRGLEELEEDAKGDDITAVKARNKLREMYHD